MARLRQPWSKWYTQRFRGATTGYRKAKREQKERNA